MATVDTYFAPAERLSNDDIYTQTIKVLGLRKLLPVLNIFPNLVAILNEQRQVLYANDAFSEAIGMEHFEEGLGQRPGELIACIHSHDHIHGCGTSKACRYCGIVLTILNAQETGEKKEDTAKVTIKKKGEKVTLDLHVIVSPIIIDYETFYLTIISDICK
jgi:PAS domain-containing protein